MKVKKIVLALVFFVALGLVFGISTPKAQAVTEAELRAQIQALQAQLAQLRTQLAQLQGTQATWCHNFNANLKIGMGGSEVRALQTALQKEGLYSKAITGMFDLNTASAVVGFQEKYASEILAPWGLSHGTGFVGRTTRLKLNELYGCGITPPPHPTTPSIHVLSPNGGEKWEVGKSYTIRWDASPQVAKVDISLQKEGTSYFKFIARNVIASSGQYNWKIDVPTGRYKLYIGTTPSWGTHAYDFSDNYFSIVSPSTPYIHVLSPNGGEKLIAGRTYTIKWGSEGVKFVNIDVVKENHAWSIVQRVPASRGRYSWIIPSNFEIDDTYKVHVWEANIPPEVEDWSDNYFSIVPPSTPYIHVLSPNGGEEWVKGNTYDIRWTSAGVENVNINLVSYKGGTSSKRIATLVSASLGKYSWTIPENSNSGERCYKIKIWGGIEPYPTTVSDESDDYFSIASSEISCTDTDGGKDYYIKGSATDRYSRAWADRCINTDELSEVFCSEKNTVDAVRYTCPYGCKDGACQPGITVLSPNGGEKWEAGKTYEIRWNSTGVDTVMIELNKGNQGYWHLAYNLPASLGRYTWKIPDTQILGDNYKIKVIGQGNGAGIEDTSDNYFSIVPPTTPSIHVLSPNGGEKWEAGKIYEITWASAGIDKVAICVNYGGGCLELGGISTTGIDASLGKFSWWIDPNAPYIPGGNLKIRVYDVRKTIFDESDDYFSIVSSGVGLESVRDQLASVSNAVSRLVEKIEEWLKR